MSRNLSLKLTMFKRWFNILTGRTAVAFKQDKGKAYSLTEVRGFYNDLTLKVSDETDTDDEGIPMSLLSGGRHAYFPIAIFQYGLANYDLWLLQNSSENYELFLKAGNWGMDNQREDGSWDCFGPIESQKYTVSAMGQGEGAALLIRMYLERKDQRFLEAAKHAIDFMLTPIEEGGTAHYENDRGLILEEYASPERNTVLNGWIFAFFGLYDFTKIYKDKQYKEYLDNTVEMMVKLLPSYDLGYWSKYDLTGKVASPAYQSLHVALLSVMEEITGNKIFKEYSEKWEKDLNSKINKAHAVVKKFFQKVFEDTDAVIIK